MALQRNALLLVVITIAIVLLPSLSKAAPAGQWISRQSTCRGTVSYCTGEEIEMYSEVSRRILAMSNHIGYGALKPDTTPCDRRGQSYYNCRPGAEANPYKRGCSAITRCRS